MLLMLSQRISVGLDKSKPNSKYSHHKYEMFRVASKTALYSASVNESATLGCSLLDQATGVSPNLSDI